MERKIITHVVDNRNSSTEVLMKYESGREVQTSQTISVTDESGSDKGFEAGTSVKAEASFGIPVIGQTKVTAEANFKYSERNMKKTINSQQDNTIQKVYHQALNHTGEKPGL